MALPWILCGALLLAVALLAAKVWSLQAGLDEIGAQLAEILAEESNTLLRVSGGDRHLRRLAARLNRQMRQLRRQRQQYRSGSRELREAVTNVSHDLRTPLTAICGYLDLLAAQEQPPATARYLQIIGGRVEALRQLTEELFDYSVFSAADTAPGRPVVLNDVLAESVAGFYAALKEGGIEPAVTLPPTKVVRCLDPAALSRVLENLLQNAIKYSDGDLTISLSAAGEIAFVNTASGLDQVQVGQLFDRYYTVRTARKSTGLGLGIARTLVTRLGGTMTAEYAGQKLCIRVWLPASADSTEAGSPSPK